MAVDPARAKSLFLAASDLPNSVQRAAYLDQECGDNADLRNRVEALLRVNVAAPLPPAEAGAAPMHLAALPPQTADYGDPNNVAGTVIAGKYKLLQQIGEGGMGTVWMADQTAPIKRRVAVKLIRTERGQSKTILSRFEAERQAIALMDHPHIAKLLDAGTTEAGEPFFVMELVKGHPLTEYCDAHKLSIQDRLNLFTMICSAVQHAHQKGIIHRDLKPSNILVESHDGKSVPKVIDFGLAKATSGLQLTENTLFTGFGTVMGTPLYMAPEQANFNAIDIDTRADVYALGVILYELLTGTTPLTRETIKKAAMDEMLRLVREMEAPTPSSRLSSSEAKPTIAANRQMEPARLGHLVKGELDWIVLKAISKDRDRRYETANGFARDIERFLIHEPVQAGPPSASYRLRKFVRRNRLQVITSAVVLLTLVAGVVGTSLALFEAQRQKGIALEEVVKKEQARKKTREALDTLTSDALSEWFTREQTLSQVQTDVLHRLLGHYAEFAEEGGDSADDRKGQVRALVRVGRIQRALGDHPAANVALRRAVELAGTAESPIADDAEGLSVIAYSNLELATMNKMNGDPKEAEFHLRKSLAAAFRMKSKTAPPHHIARIQISGARVNLADALADQGRFDEGDEEQRTAAAELEQLVSEFPEDKVARENLAVLLHNRANTLRTRGQLQDALFQNGRALEMQRRALAEAPESLIPRTRLLEVLRQQSILLADARRQNEAVEIRREAIRIGFSLCENFPTVLEHRTNLAKDYSTLAHHLLGLGKPEESEEAASKAVAVLRQVSADFPDNLFVRAELVGSLTEYCVAHDKRNIKKAKDAALEALAEVERLASMGFKTQSIRNLRTRALRAFAIALRNEGRHSESLAAMKDSLNELAQLAEDQPDNVVYMNGLCLGHIDLARSLVYQREADAAIVELQTALTKLDRFEPKERQRLHSAILFELASACGMSGRWKESEEYAGQSVEKAIILTRENPDFQEHKACQTQSHWRRATARDQLGRYSDAATDWKSAADLADMPMDKAFYLANCGSSLAKSGKLEQASAEFGAAIHHAETQLKAGELAGQTYYDAAVVYALAAEALTDPDAVERHSAEAVRLLSRAASVGFLSDPAQLKALLADTAFVRLQERSDFKEVLSSQNQKVPSE